MLSAVLRYWGEASVHGLNTDTFSASFRSVAEGLEHESKQYLEARHLLLEVSKRILDPTLPDGPTSERKDERAFTWAKKISAPKRFAFFQDKIAKLQIWQEGQNFLLLKGVAQIFMDDLKQSCDDLYDAITTEEGGSDLLAVQANPTDVVWRQDHPEVQAIPVVESLSREIQLRKCPGYSPTYADLSAGGLAGVSRSYLRPRIAYSKRTPLGALTTAKGGQLPSQPNIDGSEHGRNVPQEHCLLPRKIIEPDSEFSTTTCDDEMWPRIVRDSAGETTPVDTAEATCNEALTGVHHTIDIVSDHDQIPAVQSASSSEGGIVAVGVSDSVDDDAHNVSSAQTATADGTALRLWLRRGSLSLEEDLVLTPAPSADSSGGGTGRAFIRRSKINAERQRREQLRCLHGQLKVSGQQQQAKEKSTRVSLRNEEPFVAHLVNRAELLNVAFQQHVSSLFSEWGEFTLSGASLPQVVPGPVKTKQRMMEKAASYTEEKHDDAQLPMAAMILDPVRVSLVCQSTLQVLQCTRWLLEHGAENDLPVVRLKNTFAAQDSTEYDGYRDIMLCVVFKGSFGLNIIGEIQIQDERMHALKVKMHRLYKVKRATAADKI